MRLQSDRTFVFSTLRAELWQAVSAVEEYGRWWPWLRSFDGSALATGEVWRCEVQPPLPYALRFSIRLEEVDPARHVRATVDGDIVGSARLELSDHPGGCRARLSSDLAPRHRVLRAVASLAAPVARYGHDWVLDTGARQFVGRFGPALPA